MRELDTGKLAMLKMRGWEFLFYPADMVEVFRPDELGSVDRGQFLGSWNLPRYIEYFFDEEFGDG